MINMKITLKTYDELTKKMQKENQAQQYGQVHFRTGKVGTEGLLREQKTITEIECSGIISSSYFYYATIDGKTLPVEKSIISTLFGEAQKQKEISNFLEAWQASPEATRGKFHHTLYEVIASQVPATATNSARWNIHAIREKGKPYAYVNEKLIDKKLVKDGEYKSPLQKLKIKILKLLK